MNFCVSPPCAKPPSRCVQAATASSGKYHLEKKVHLDSVVDKARKRQSENKVLNNNIVMVQYNNFDRVLEARDHFKNKTSSKSLMVGILLFLFVVSVFGQTTSISREQMIQDIDVLFSTIEEVHPDMYAVYPKEQLDKDIERVKSQLEPSGDIFYFYKQVTPLVAQLGDGHTTVYPFLNFLYPDLWKIANIHLFPFSVKVTYPDKVIHVQNDHTQTQNTIPIGAQITSINNRKASEIVQEMMSYVSGEKDFYRVDRLKELFSPLIYILYGDNIFDIEYVFNQEKYSIQVKGVSYQEISEISEEEMLNNPYIFSTLPDKNIGIIEFNSFIDRGRFKLFLNSTFQVLQKENIGNLIIDLRKNDGGNSGLGDELFQYISLVPFSQYGKTIVKYSDIQRERYKSRGEISIPRNRNGIKIYENKKLNRLKRNKLRYNGNVYLLTSHTTFSSAASFSWAFKYFKMGTVVGEETGGMAVGFIDMIPQKLPNSGLRYGISHKKFYFYGATDENTHGTLPDYEVEAEKALDFTIDLIMRDK